MVAWLSFFPYTFPIGMALGNPQSKRQLRAWELNAYVIQVRGDGSAYAQASNKEALEKSA